MTIVAQGMGRRCARALAVAVVAGVAGCAELMPAIETSTTAPPPRETAHVPPQITTVPPEPPASASVRPAPATRKQKELPQQPKVAVDPEGLLGLDASGLHRRLGTPSEVETEGPAEVWQYAVGDCVLKLYLYADIGTGARRTLRYDSAPASGKNTDCSPPLTTTSSADGQG